MQHILPAIEANTIYQIPLDQRHGKPGDLFAIWFSANIMMLTVVTGALAPTVYHLTLLQSVVAIVLGNAVGGVFMALHAAQGPELGVPQMVQTRGQFGTVGAVAVIALVVLMYVGFIAANFVLGGESLHLLLGGLGPHGYAVAICLVSLAAAIYGHDVIHAYSRYLAWLAGAALLLCFFWVAFVHGVPAAAFTKGAFSINGFLGAVSVGALWQIAYAPYVADYSRYLPPGAGARRAFWASYAGCVLGSVFPMALGALLAVVAGTANITDAFGVTMGPIVLIVLPVLSFGIAAGSAMNIYCGVLAGITVVQTFLPRWRARAVDRVLASCLMAGASVVLAVLAAGNFLENYTNFILLLLYVLVPWTAINLVDFYLIRHGAYDVDAFFRPDGGRYGQYNVPALVCYAAGIVVQIPFVSNPLYTGVVARLLGGADVSWVVGLVVVGPLYWGVVKVRKEGLLF